MRPCPHCQYTVADNATTCPQCGGRFKSLVVQQAQAASSKSFWKGALIFVIVISILAFGNLFLNW